MQEQAVLSIRNVTKIFEGKQRIVAVDGVSLDVQQGAIFGLLGPNGAGKTTTISICTTRAWPSQGTVLIAGIDVVRRPAHARRLMGIVTQLNTLDRSLTVFENIYFHSRYFGLTHEDASKRTRDLLSQFKLKEREAALPDQLSGGLVQRLQLARAVAHRPKVLFLDEPSGGLDPQSRLALWELIREMRSAGATVVLTTHYMEEADQLCDQVAILDHGRVLVCDTPTALKNSLGGMRLFQLHLRNPTAEIASGLAKLPGVAAIDSTETGFRILAKRQDGLLAQIVTVAGDELHDLTLTEPNLETVFIKLTGRDLRE